MRISDWSSDVCSSDLDPGVAWGTGERDQPVLGKRLDLGPERGEMDAAIDRERGDAAGPRLLREQRPSPLEGELRETAARIDAHQPGCAGGDARLGVEHPDRKSTRLNSSH